jgi:hypothetical protein
MSKYKVNFKEKTVTVSLEYFWKLRKAAGAWRRFMSETNPTESPSNVFSRIRATNPLPFQSVARHRLPLVIIGNLPYATIIRETDVAVKKRA